MSKNKILLLFSNHRVAEKLWPIIPKLAETRLVDILLVGLCSYDTPWIGDIDERHEKINKYRKYLNEVIIGPGIKYHGEWIKQPLSDYVILDNYSLVIYDDNREMSEYNIPNFYQECKCKNITVVGNMHGNEDTPHNAFNVSYDKQMDFETGGIPANDTLKHITKTQDHILIITNFLGNRYSPFSVNFDKYFVEECGVKELSEQYKLPIKVKIKTRLDNPEYIESIKYVKQLLNCEVIANTTNIDELIGNSAIVISAPSTLAFKPIQLGIPTVLIKDSGQLGRFSKYPGVVKLNKQVIFDNLQTQIDHGRYEEFINETISGGCDFTSTDIYLKNIKELL